MTNVIYLNFMTEHNEVSVLSTLKHGLILISINGVSPTGLFKIISINFLDIPPQYFYSFSLKSNKKLPHLHRFEIRIFNTTIIQVN